MPKFSWAVPLELDFNEGVPKNNTAKEHASLIAFLAGTVLLLSQSCHSREFASARVRVLIRFG